MVVGGKAYYGYPSRPRPGTHARLTTARALLQQRHALVEPGFCADSWCYVDIANCDKPASSSAYFAAAEMHFSYFACGNQNTFTSWFLSGGTATHTLGDLVGVIHTYLSSFVEILENNEIEIRARRARSLPCASTRPPAVRASGAPTTTTGARRNDASLDLSTTSFSTERGRTRRARAP